MKATIIGSGVYGKAMANVLLASGCEVMMWTEQKDLQNVQVRDEIKLTNSYIEAAKFSDTIFILTGSKFVESILKEISPYISPTTLVILGSKGILEDGTLMIDLAKRTLSTDHYAVISGPTFAKDIAALDPIGFTIGTVYDDDFEKIKGRLKTVHLEHSRDLVGIELAGSLKNAYAIGSGLIKGLKYGHSTSCLYITKILKEMSTIFEAIGADEKTIITLAGVGDLVLTCTSDTSRNFTFGLLFAENEDSALEYLANTTVEGYENLKSYIDLFSQKNISAPILECVSDIVAQKKNSDELIKLLQQYSSEE